MVNLEDLATIKAKIISFSLQGPFMRKVFFPYQIEKRATLAGTELDEDMFQGYYIMKQMSLGIQSDNKTKFE